MCGEWPKSPQLEVHMKTRSPEEQKGHSRNCQIDDGPDTELPPKFRATNSVGMHSCRKLKKSQTAKHVYRAPLCEPCEIKLGRVRRLLEGAHDLVKLAENGLWSGKADSTLLPQGKSACE